MKITITGPAAAIESSTEQEIVNPAVLRKFHGCKSDDSCVEYFDDSLGEIGLIGGYLEFVFDEPSQRLRITTVYQLPRLLKKKELESLVKDTQGQWSDGIGENGVESSDENVQLDPYPMLIGGIDVNDVTVEQVDDGVKVTKPRKSPLFAAVLKNDVAKLTKLLDCGEQLESRDRQGMTPLHVAIYENKIEAARLLIERGAKVDIAGKTGFGAIQSAAMFGHIEILEAMLKAGADPNFMGPNDYTQHPPLHMACNRHQAQAVRLLVEYGADVNFACESGYTPLLHLKEQDVEIARFLIEKGANIDAVNAFNVGIDKKLKAAIS